jgi:alkanesulfonate monooxygenase SsuD/methylene tetrahydromethanopterin reductase-like flavin-dependent oxidoreductase (luciferase family)
VIAALAATTERLRLGVLVCGLARRRPWKVARETASLDLLSDGRLVFGAGLGSHPGEYEDFGEDSDARVRAARLDEGLAIIDGLWSGEPLAHRGEQYSISTDAFRPRPLQRPRIPVWIAGRWPAKRPFRRAARWDGVFPTREGVGHDQTMTPAELAEIVEYTRSHREAEGAFDVVLEGQTDGEDPARDRELVEAYAEAGLTWWIEKLGWYRGSVEQVRSRIAAGPPRTA